MQVRKFVRKQISCRQIEFRMYRRLVGRGQLFLQSVRWHQGRDVSDAYLAVIGRLVMTGVVVQIKKMER